MFCFVIFNCNFMPLALKQASLEVNKPNEYPSHQFHTSCKAFFFNSCRRRTRLTVYISATSFPALAAILTPEKLSVTIPAACSVWINYKIWKHIAVKWQKKRKNTIFLMPPRVLSIGSCLRLFPPTKIIPHCTTEHRT